MPRAQPGVKMSRVQISPARLRQCRSRVRCRSCLCLRFGLFPRNLHVVFGTGAEVWNKVTSAGEPSARRGSLAPQLVHRGEENLMGATAALSLPD